MNRECRIPVLKKRRLLESLDEEELKSLKVEIKRKDVSPTNKLKPLIRDLGDPASLKVHFETEGEQKDQPIFKRDDIIVNSVDESSSSENKNNNRSSPESKYSTRSVSGSPERDRRNSPRRYKKHHEENYRISKSPQPYSNRTQKRESSSPSSSKRRLRSRSKSRSPSLRPGEYRPRRSISRSLRHKSKSRSRSPSRRARPGEYIPKKRPGEYIPRKNSRSPELRPSERLVRKRSRSRTPSRRPRKRSRSPPLRPGEYRPSKHKELDENFEAHPNPYDYSFYNEISYGRTPPFLPRPIFRQMLVPQVQFVPYTAFPPVRASFVRPPKIYNNRSYPNLMIAPASSSTAQSNTATKKDEETNELDSPSDQSEE